MSSLPSLAGRRIWIAGIGGAGMSGYALLARAWGAEVAGWDRVETPYLRHLEGVAIEISQEPPAPPFGWEVYVSTAFADRVEGRPRSDLLAELVSLQRAIVVAGAHGKTTTSAMIAFCLDRLGLDPAFLIGGEVPQLGGNARVGSGWLVVEGDESDRSVGALRPEIAVLLNVDLDHHTTFASRGEVESFFEDWLREVPHVVRAEELDPLTFELAVPGDHNRRNAAAALAALELAGVPRTDAESAIGEFGGASRRLELKGEAGGVAVLDSYAHHPAELAADLAALRNGGRLLALFQPHLYSRTLHLAHGFAEALAGADAACVTEIYRAREEPVPEVSGRLIVDELAAIRPGMRIGWAPSLEDAARLVAAWAHPGDTVLTLGAGDVDSAAALILEALA
jgi:UDP-N-acetylmuramate--alanine ligase